MKKPSFKKFENSTRRESSGGDQSSMPDSLPKRPVPGPTSLKEVIFIVVFHVFKKPLFVDIYAKVVVYVLGVTLGSVFFDILRAPPTYLSNKQNIFNMMMVKWGWAWTASLLAFFIIASSFVYTAAQRPLIRCHLMRLLVGSVCWLLSTNVFNAIENFTGSCGPGTHSHLRNKRSCSRAGGTWTGVDISGHTFLLILCNLWIIEETKILRDWTRIGALTAPGSENPQSRALSEDVTKKIHSSYKRLTGAIKATAVVLSLLSVLWDFMLIVTVIYFHNMPSKFAGMMTAVGCWLITYKLWFPLNIKFCPGMPGDGVIKYMTS